MSFDPNGIYATYVDLDGDIYAYQGGLYYDHYGNTFSTVPKPLRGLVSPAVMIGASSLIKTVTTSTTATMDDGTILCNATGGVINVTLPLASAAFANNVGKKYVVKKIDSSGNAVNIVRAGSDLIDGATSISMSSQWSVTEVQSNGLAWYTISLS